MFYRFTSLPHPPVYLVAAAIECLSVLVEKEPTETWNQLIRTNFFPHLIGTRDM